MPFSCETERVFAQVWADKLDEPQYLVGRELRVVNLKCLISHVINALE